MSTKPKPKARRSKLRRRAAHELGEFDDHPEHRPLMLELYRRAEAQLRKHKKAQPAKTPSVKTVEDTPRLLHELQVHQVELEMQNTELEESRDRAEELLEKFADLYDFAPVGYFTLDINGNIQLANLTGAHLVRIERARLTGRPFARLVSTAQRPAFNAFLKQVFADQTKKSIDFELSCPGQPPRAVNIEAQQLFGGRECRAVVVDITERKEVETKVRVSELRYRRLFEAAHDGVLLVNPGTCKITDANPFMTELLGYSRDQLIGKELYEIGLLRDEAASQEMFRKLKQNREVRYEDLPLESQAGRHQEVEVVANLYQEGGHAVIQCNIRDITERKLAEDALRASEERYRILFELGPVAVYSCDAAGVIRNFNRHAAKLWGHKPKARHSGAQFHAAHKLFRPDGRRMRHHQTPMARVLSGELDEVSDAELIVERADGSRLILIVNIRPIKDASGEITGAINCFYDITERRTAEQAERRSEILAASNEKLEREIVRRQAVEKTLREGEQQQILLLEQSHRMQARLRHLSRQVLHVQEEERKNISRELHDVIAQTLTGINIRLAALANEAMLHPKRLGRSIARTQRLVKRSVDVVHEFARELRPAVLDDFGLIPALRSFVTQFSKRARIRVRLKVVPGIEQMDGKYRIVFFRVAQEALTNVARHAHASRVEISVEKRSDCFCMKVTDNGKSFDAERAMRTSGSKRLGLLGMKERLETVHGHFNITSAPGKGTTVEAWIPDQKSREGGGRSPIKSPEASTSSR